MTPRQSAGRLDQTSRGLMDMRFTLCCEAEQVMDRLEGEFGPAHLARQRM